MRSSGAGEDCTRRHGTWVNDTAPSSAAEKATTEPVEVRTRQRWLLLARIGRYHGGLHGLLTGP